MAKEVLKVTDLDAEYGLVKALFGINATFAEGSVVAILGANGAGKSTFGRVLCGLVPSTAGQIVLDGSHLENLGAHAIRRRGLIYVPEGRGIFPRLTVEENLRMSTRTLPRRSRRAAVERSFELFQVLRGRRTQIAGSMSGGEQQMLSLARALAVPPRVIIADEMSMGLAPKIVESVFEALSKARSEGITIILIEQFVHRALELADDCLILKQGRVAWAGAAAAAHDRIVDGYLGDAQTPEIPAERAASRDKFVM